MIALPKTLSFRLTWSYALTFSLFFLSGLVLCYFLLTTVLDKRMQDSLTQDIEELGTLFASGGLPRVIEELDLEIAENGVKSIFFHIVDGRGETLFVSDLSSWEGVEIDPSTIAALTMGPEKSLLNDDLESDGEPAQGIFGRIGHDQYLLIGESMEETEELLGIVLTIFLAVFTLVLPIAAWIGWRISRRAVQGVREVTRVAHELHGGHFDQQVNIEAQDEEIQDLVTTFNRMAERIRSLMAELREMIDNIAHDLRSPLTRIRIIAESSAVPDTSLAESQNATQEILVECERLLKLINTTLDVAEAEAEINHKDLEPLDFAALTAEVCELYQPLAEQKKISLINQIDKTHTLLGQKQNLLRMLANLVDNALKYTPVNGSVKVHLHRDPTSDNGIVLDVTDTGIGIPESDQPFIFNRFYRCDNSRAEEGCGLGLSYAVAVVKAHGGRINFTSTPSAGTTFSLFFA